MSQPEPQPQPKVEPLRVLCPECGAITEVLDPAALVRALHLMNECELSSIITGSSS